MPRNMLWDMGEGLLAGLVSPILGGAIYGTMMGLYLPSAHPTTGMICFFAPAAGYSYWRWNALELKAAYVAFLIPASLATAATIGIHIALLILLYFHPTIFLFF